MNMVDLYFPSAGLSVIAEPGRFFVSSAFSFAVNIISKEVVARDGQDQAHGELHFPKKRIKKESNRVSAIWVTNKINLPPRTDEPSSHDEPEFQYYMNQGVYGSFASKLTEMHIASPSAHKVNQLFILQDSFNCCTF